MEDRQTWWIDYGDDIDIEVPQPSGPRHAAPVGPRHAAPRQPRQKRSLARRLVRWALVYVVLYAVAAVVLAVHPPTFHLYFPVEPSPSASVTSTTPAAK